MPKSGKISYIWNYFQVESNDVSRAKCIICKVSLSRGSSDPKKMTTSNLLSHMKKAHSNVHQSNVDAAIPSTSSKESSQIKKFCISKPCSDSLVQDTDDPNTAAEKEPEIIREQTTASKRQVNFV